MRTITRFLKPYWALALLSILFLSAGSIADLMMPNLMSYIVNDGIIGGNEAVIYRMGILMMLMALLNAAVRLTNSYIAARTATGLSHDLRSALFRKVQSFSEAEIDQVGTSSLITRSTTDVQQLQNFIGMFLRFGFTAPVMAIGGAFMAIHKSPKLASVLIITLPILILSVVGISRVALPLTRSMLLKVDRVNLVMREKLTGVRVIRAFGTEDYEQQRFDGANRDLTETSLKMTRIMSTMGPVMTIALNLATVIVVYMGAVEASYGGLMVGDIMAVVQYVTQMLGSARMISMLFIMWPRVSASANRIGEVLESHNSVEDGQSDATPLSGHVAFDQVSFRYPGADRPTLYDITFEALPGETTAIIGSTGSGKSTILSLLLRAYDPTEGEIRLDGIDIRKLTLESYRQKLGYVPQRAVLFSGTAGDNIRMGKSDALQHEVRLAADIAQASSFIEAREGGYDSVVDQGGANLSGGQKQRLSIARAVVRNPAIFVFDDSFSALDFKTDAELRRRLADVTGGAAVIIVAQRVATIMDAHRIVVLDEGRIAGIGKHRDLLGSCAVYREIVLSQLSEEEAAGS